MLDGKRYYGAFPDEKPTHALLRTLEKLEGEFRRYVEQSGEGDAPEIGPRPSEGSAPSLTRTNPQRRTGGDIGLRCSPFSRLIARRFQRLMPASFKSSPIH
jgi:hypothetical protein